MRIVVEREIPENDTLCQAWNHLAGEMERPEVFYTYEWALAVQRAYGSRFAPLLMLAYEGEKLAAGVSLAVDRQRSDEVVFLAATTADYCDFLSAPEKREDWVGLVLRELRGLQLTKLTLANLPAQSGTVAAVKNSARSHGYFQYIRHSYSCAQVVIPQHEERERLRQAISSKKMLRRSMRAMEKIAPVELSTRRQWSEIEPALAQFTNAHVARFLDTGRISNLVDPERREFLHQLAGLLSAKGWMAFSLLKLADKSIAWNYGFSYRGCWFWYQPTFRSEYAHFSPGYCLLGKIIGAACQSPEITRVDLGLGEEEYKGRFAVSASETLHVSMNRSYGAHLGTAARHRLGSLVKRSPVIERLIRNLLCHWRGLRKRLDAHSWRKFVQWLGARVWHRWFGTDEVLFFQAEALRPLRSPDLNHDCLQPLTMELLASAAADYSDEEETLQYILRAAQRLKSGAGRGFAWVGQGVPLHFAWVTGFEGFYMAELERGLVSPGKDAQLIFDCWTPIRLRGRGYYSHALAALAADLAAHAPEPWIFGAGQNLATLKGIEKAGFKHRFTMVRKRFFGIARVGNRPRLSSWITDDKLLSAEATAGKM